MTALNYLASVQQRTEGEGPLPLAVARSSHQSAGVTKAGGLASWLDLVTLVSDTGIGGKPTQSTSAREQGNDSLEDRVAVAQLHQTTKRQEVEKGTESRSGKGKEEGRVDSSKDEFTNNDKFRDESHLKDKGEFRDIGQNTSENLQKSLSINHKESSAGDKNESSGREKTQPATKTASAKNDVDPVVHEGKPPSTQQGKKKNASIASEKVGKLTGKENASVSLGKLQVKWDNVPPEVIQMAPEVFAKVPRQFLPEFKNPCWYRGSSELVCLPYFYMIGMPKCGTTDVWDKLIAHPDVVGGVPKEPHWWARRRKGWTETPIHKKTVLLIRNQTGGKNDASFEWYLNWFKNVAVEVIKERPWNNSDDSVTYPMVFGDASISTAWDNGKQWRGELDHRTNADLIHAVQPKAKIIMILRNPTDRDYSAYYYNGGTSDGAFHQTVSSHVGCFRKCLTSRREEYCTYVTRCNRHKSLYLFYVKDWIRVYGRSGVHVMTLEDWHADTAGEYRKLLRFLQLRDLTEEQIKRITARKSQNVNSRKAGGHTMWNSTRQILDDFYRPYNVRLARFLNDTKYTFSRQRT
ncbi:carbohydrate sulfotransferase 15-like [Diadema antillarum]|uniref:carbohydrate sulfotransferase 15-like n=1 Tax=Diadema antillarum TaxID=105358 RepID=UPI003A85E6F7